MAPKRKQVWFACRRSDGRPAVARSVNALPKDCQFPAKKLYLSGSKRAALAFVRTFNPFDGYSKTNRKARRTRRASKRS